MYARLSVSRGMLANVRLTDAFDQLGISTKGRNIRTMWSGRSTDGKIVAVTLWSDMFADGDRRVYDTIPRRLGEDGMSPAAKRRLDDLRHAQRHCGGVFTSIIVTPADGLHSRTKSREIGPRMRIVAIDEQTGEFRAERVD
jgi:hypothetical protein